MYSEYKFIIFLIIAVVFLILHFISDKADKTVYEEFEGTGVITMLNTDDSGHPWFYVDININGVIHSAQTDKYRTAPRDLAEGDEVNVIYSYTKKGDVMCYIDQEGFDRVISTDGSRKPFFLYFSLGSFALFVVLLIKTILS